MAINKDSCIRCADFKEPLSGFRLPRGQGGVLILWPVQWSSKVKKMNEGNERVIGIETSGKDKLCIINVYLPTNNSSVNSNVEYTECLHILDNMINKYRNSHKIVLCGDFNGTILTARPYNKHDQLLQNFIKEHELIFEHTTNHTFFHHSGSSSSQIDYITSSIRHYINKYIVSGTDCENTSSHVKISAHIPFQTGNATVTNQTKSIKSMKKLQWEKINKNQYISILERELKKMENKDISSVDQRIHELTQAVHTATAKAAPSKITKLKGPSWKASPKVKDLLCKCKEKYQLWMASGNLDNLLRKDNIMTKRELRKQLKTEKFNDRKNFYAELMHNPTTDKFYQLIRRNNGNRRLHTGSIVVDGKELHSADEQRSAFAKYYEDLSVPRDHGYDTAYLELCSVRHHLIAQLCEESLREPEPFTTKGVREAALQLNNKTAADELGLTAEQLKHSGCALIEDITDIANEILQSKTIPDS